MSHYNFSAWPADSNGTFPFGNINAHCGNWAKFHKQSSTHNEFSIGDRLSSLPIQLA
jgi:hypothetical protein